METGNDQEHRHRSSLGAGAYMFNIGCASRGAHVRCPLPSRSVPGEPMTRVLLVVPPFYQVFTPALGVSLLKAALAQAGVPCDVCISIFRSPKHRPGVLHGDRGRTSVRCARGRVGLCRRPVRRSGPRSAAIYRRRAARPFRDDLRPDVCRPTDGGAGPRDSVPGGVIDRVAWERLFPGGRQHHAPADGAGLALLRRLKARYPEVRTAMGGANCEGQMGAAIHELFPFVDYVCSGEGDPSSPSWCGACWPANPRKICRGSSPAVYRAPGRETHTPMVLTSTACRTLTSRTTSLSFWPADWRRMETPTMPLETSRGCWWGEKHHCTFCGLNGEGMQYRRKSPRRALEEIDFLSHHYPSRSFYATDNILDLDYFETVLRELAERPRPPQLYYMMKSNLTRAQLRLLAKAGFWGIYAGIEHLSTPILRLMRKGVTGLQNVRLLKWSAEIGLAADWALCAGFPGEDPGEYQRLAEMVPSLTHLRPPGGLYQIRVDRFSPYFTAPEAVGLANVRAGIAYRHVYPFPPADLDRLAYYFDYDYADGRDPDVHAGAAGRDRAVATVPWTAQLELRMEATDSKSKIAVRQLPDRRRSSRARAADVSRPGCGSTVAAVRGGTAQGSERTPRRGPDRAMAARMAGRATRDARGTALPEPRDELADHVQLPVDRFLAQLVERAS